MFKHGELTADDLWKKIQHGDESNFVMCTSTFSAYKEKLSSEEVTRNGLVDGHAYSLLNVRVLSVGEKEV
jgi:hypothetical protein